VCATDEHWANLTEAIGRPDLRESEEVNALCEKHHIPAAPLRDVMEVVADPHLHARGFLTDQVTEAGRVALPNSPIRYEGSALRPLTSSPSLGEQTEEVLTLGKLPGDGVEVECGFVRGPRRPL